MQQRALEHQAGADTGADPEHHQAAVAGLAEGVLAEDGGVGVVGDEDREAEAPRARLVASGVSVQAEVGRVDDGAVGVDDTGAADADAEHRAVGHRDQLGGEPVHQRDRVVARGAVEWRARGGPGPRRRG